MSPRTELVDRLTYYVGPALEIEEVATGWPSLATLHIDGRPHAIALFVSSVGSSHRGRDEIERRFQNPAGKMPIVAVPGRESILLGIWEDDVNGDVTNPILAMAETDHRGDGRTTRWSVFLMVSALYDALRSGWSTNVSSTGEVIRYFHPALLPVAVEASKSGGEPEPQAIHRAVWAAGLIGGASGAVDPSHVERVRRTVTSLVRDSRFSGAVLSAYRGRCAMCGLGLSLVQGAHIYPASAPGSRDEVTNGLALCANHHQAFDRHLIAVQPDTLEVLLHPSVLESASVDGAAASFVESTLATLLATSAVNAPNPDAFQQRYEFYGHQYDWARS